jgi:hypothetical protein
MKDIRDKFLLSLFFSSNSISLIPGNVVDDGSARNKKELVQQSIVPGYYRSLIIFGKLSWDRALSYPNYSSTLLKRVNQASWPFYEPDPNSQRRVKCTMRSAKDDHCRSSSSLPRAYIELWQYHSLRANLCVGGYEVLGAVLVLAICFVQGTSAPASYQRLPFLMNRLGTIFEC